MAVSNEEFFKRFADLVKDINSTIQCAAQPSNFRGQGRIIDLIAHHEGCAQRELAVLAGVKPGSLTEVLEPWSATVMCHASVMNGTGG